MPKNLWGEIPQAERIRIPATILQEQAEIIGELTGGVIRGKINTGTDSDGDIFCNLELLVPSLNNYRYMLIYTFYHPPFSYPSYVKASWESQYVEANNSEAFEELLGRILGAERTKMIISSFLAQANAAQPVVQIKKK